LIWTLTISILEPEFDIGQLFNMPPFFETPPANLEFTVKEVDL